MLVLAVDDDVKLVRILRNGFADEGWSLRSVSDGRAAIAHAPACLADCILLDLDLPDMDGIEVCQELRRREVRTPILVLTARDAPTDRAAAREAGADGYLAKPFGFEELLSRVRALVRQSEPDALGSKTASDLVLDPETQQVLRAGREIRLVSKEFALLQLLMRDEGRIWSRTEIQEQLWGIRDPGLLNVVDIYARELQRKIDEPFSTRLIHSLGESGYVLRAT